MATQRWRKFWVWDIAPNLLTSTLGAAPTPPPFAQTDWPNPRLPAQPLENRGFLHNASVQLIGQDRFFGAPGQTQTYDWPNPRAPLQPQENRGFVRAANIQLVGQDKFFGALGQAPTYDYPNPQRPRYPIQPEIPPNLLTAVFSVVVFPFAQMDWPNPRSFAQPLENRGFVRAANVQLIGMDQFFGALGEAPTYDWPLPFRPRYPVQPEPPPNLAIIHTAIAAPFYQLDWPNPKAPKQPQENQGFFRAANVQLIGMDQFFGAPGQAPVYDWPNPLRPRYPIQPEPPLITVFVPPAPPPPPLSPIADPTRLWIEAARGLVWIEDARPTTWEA